MNQEKNNQEPEPQRRVEKNEHVLREGIDLSGRLKDSGERFQDERQQPGQTFYPGTPKIIQRMIKYSGGLIRNERQAAYILIGFVALAIIVTIIIVVSSGSNQPTPGPVPADQFVP